jgi:ATP-dependent protease ClpP protease subunit
MESYKNGSSDNVYVSKVDNNIFYSGSITHEGANEFQNLVYRYMSKCKYGDKKHKSDKKKNKDICKELNIHITSGGGGVSSGIAIMNTIEEVNNFKINDKNIHTRCIGKGFVGSAATYGLFSCKERTASANTTFLLHPPSKSCVSGQTEDLQTSANNITLTHNNILDIYNKKSNKQNIEDDIREIYENNKYSKADDILNLGLIDKVL